MSWLSNAWKAVTKGATDVGHTVGSIASNPIVDTLAGAALSATGIGAPLGAAIIGGGAGLGRLMAPGGNLGKAALSGVTGAAEGYGGSKLGSLLGIAKAAGGANPTSTDGTTSNYGGGGGQDGTSGDNGSGSSGLWNPATDNGSSAGQDSGGSIWGKIGNSITGGLKGTFMNPDGSLNIGNIAKAGLAGAGLVGSIQSSNQANNFFKSQQDKANQLLTQANADYASRAPLRNAAFANLGQMIQRGPSTAPVFSGFLSKEANKPQTSAATQGAGTGAY